MSKNLKMTPKNTCCICGGIYSGFGHNAAPVKKGICCDFCDSYYVIPTRIKQFRESNTKKSN